MKPIFAWVCLVIYLNAAAYTLTPWIVDIFAHAFFWQDHIEHVHNGKKHSHHVGAEMAAQEDEAHSHLPISHSTVSGKDILTAHIAPQHFTIQTPKVIITNAPLNVRWTFQYKNICSAIFLPPPDRAI